jgi:thioesterase domain-containing protein
MSLLRDRTAIDGVAWRSIATVPQQSDFHVQIVHAGNASQVAERLAAELNGFVDVTIVDAQAALRTEPRPGTLYFLAARLAADGTNTADDRRSIVIGLGRIGGVLARALAVEWLGRDKAVEAIFLIGNAIGDSAGSTATAPSESLRWSEPLTVWSQHEDEYRIRSSPVDEGRAASWLRTQLNEFAGAEPYRSPQPSVLTLRSSRPERSKAFCIPGAGASVVSLLDLSQAAPIDTGVYGVQPRGLDGVSPPYTTVSAVAAAIEPLIVEQLDGSPFHLVGHSFGGCVAFELACRLVERGLQPQSVSLIDTRPPRATPQADDIDDVELLLRWISLNELAIERSLGITAGDFRTGDMTHNLAVVHRGMVRVGLLPAQTAPTDLLGPMRMFAPCVRNWYHTSRIYPAALRLIYLDDPTLDLAGNAHLGAASRSGWQQRAPLLDFRRGTGNHITGLKAPHAAALSALLAWGSETC